MRRFYYRAHCSAKWNNGPGIHVNVLEGLFNELSPKGHEPFWSERSDHAFYVIETRNLKEVIDGLKGMTDEAYKNRFHFEDGIPSINRVDIISELEDLYENRDMNWHGGNRIILEWY